MRFLHLITRSLKPVGYHAGQTSWTLYQLLLSGNQPSCSVPSRKFLQHPDSVKPRFVEEWKLAERTLLMWESLPLSVIRGWRECQIICQMPD